MTLTDRIIRYGGLAVATLFVLAVTFATEGRSAIPQPFRVIDGDTLEVQGKKYRLRGYDAPETYRPRCSLELKKGEAAKLTVTALLKDPTATFIPLGTFDKYGRELAEIVIGTQQLYSIMINSGLALPSTGRTKRPNWCYCLRRGTCFR